MKPNEVEIAWCLANRELVMRWLEQRGGWQEFDFAAIEGAIFGVGRETDGSTLFYNPETDQWYEREWFDSIPVWLPAIGDVIGLLEKKGHDDVYIRKTTTMYHRLRGDRFMVGKDIAGPIWVGATHLIALMELLRASEAGGDHAD